MAVTTKRLLVVIFGILGGLSLLVALFVGAILGLAFYTIGKSEAASTAKRFLKENEKLKQDVGEVRDFGSLVTGSINTGEENGTATLNLKVIGARRNVNATVSMAHSHTGRWLVTDASYVNEAGQTVPLLDKYNDSPP